MEKLIQATDQYDHGHLQHHDADDDNDAALSSSSLAHVIIREGDFLAVQWAAEADVVFASSLCFSEETMAAIVRLCEQLRSGAIVMTLSALEGHRLHHHHHHNHNHNHQQNREGNALDHLEFVRKVSGCRMSFGTVPVFVYRRR